MLLPRYEMILLYLVNMKEDKRDTESITRAMDQNSDELFIVRDTLRRMEVIGLIESSVTNLTTVYKGSGERPQKKAVWEATDLGKKSLLKTQKTRKDFIEFLRREKEL